MRGGLRALPTARALKVQAVKAKQPVVVADEEAQSWKPLALALPLASMVAAAMIAGAVIPEEAMAARSGGRVGGGFSGGGRSAAPSRSAPAPSSSVRTYNSYSYGSPVMAPPVVVPSYGYGYSPFGGFGGFGFSPVVSFGGGGIFQIFGLLLLVSVVFNVISSVAGAARNNDEGKRKGGNSDKDGDGWGDL